MQVKDGIQLASGLILHRSDAQSASVGGIFDRVLSELVAKMRELRVDRCELGCLRAIVLFNPEAKSIRNVARVEALRESVYSTLERYCRSKYPQQLGRFAKLLLRLPALRSVALKCLDFLFICKQLPAAEMDKYLASVLSKPSLSTRLSPSNGDLLASGSESNSLMGIGLTSGNGSLVSNASASLTGTSFSELNGNGSLSGGLNVSHHSPQLAGLSPSQPLSSVQPHSHSNSSQSSYTSMSQLKSPVDGNNNQIGQSNSFGQLVFGQSAGALDGLNLLAGSAANSPLLASSVNELNGNGSLPISNHSTSGSMSLNASMQSNRFQNQSGTISINNSFGNICNSNNHNSITSHNNNNTNSAYSSMSLNGNNISSNNNNNNNAAFLLNETQSPLSL